MHQNKLLLNEYFQWTMMYPESRAMSIIKILQTHTACDVNSEVVYLDDCIDRGRLLWWESILHTISNRLILERDSIEIIASRHDQ